MRKKTLKTLATDVAIAFFYTAIFVLIVFAFFCKKINFYSSIINTIAVNETSTGEEKNTTYNSETKRVVHYPDYGKKYAELHIPSINLDLPVYFGDTMDLLRKGVGHYAGSYFPGEGGTIIYAAHNNVGFFHELINLQVKDQVTIETIYGTFTYEVDSYRVINETDLEAFPIQNDTEMLIMYTCYPVTALGRTNKRYVVYAYKVGEEV